MTKRFLTLIIIIITLGTIGAQEINNNTLLGKWKLETITVQGETIPTADAFGTSEVYQEYKENASFSAKFGDQKENGDWKLASDKKSIKISVKGSPDSTFKIKSFANNKMSLEITEEGQTLLLNYIKQ